MAIYLCWGHRVATGAMRESTPLILCTALPILFPFDLRSLTHSDKLDGAER